MLKINDLNERAEKVWKLLNPCRVCPRKCGVNRNLSKSQGFCKMGRRLKISSFRPHFGEESCLVGQRGSGTIFFSSCNLACVYCQNYEVSQLRMGQEIEIKELAQIMIYLQNLGCHNINLVSPSIWVPQILKAILIAKREGLWVPIVYNTGGYDSLETLKFLEGVIDIYMPDIKYSDDQIGLKYSLVPDYWRIVKRAVKEMYRQVGDLVIEKGIAVRGLLIRHLVLPNNLGGTLKVMRFIASLSKNSYVNIMDQYYPAYNAFRYPELNRLITSREYQEAVEIARSFGLHRFN